jgi:hypothetical protein
VLAVGWTNSVKADVVKVTLDQLKAGYGSDDAWLTIANGITYPIEVKDVTLFGSDGGTETTNADVKDYDYLYVTVTNFTENKAVRIFFWDKSQNKRLDYFLKPEADKETANFGEPSDITGNGTYCVKVPDGARLQGAKAPYGSSSNVSFKISEIYLTERETPYVELVPYTLEWTPNAGTYRATVPISESHIRTTGNVSINYSTGEVTNTGSGTLVIYLNNENLVGASGYKLTTAAGESTDAGKLGSTLDITDAVNGEVGGIYGSRNSWNIACDAGRKDKIGAITALKYNFSGTTEKDITDMPYGRWGLPANQISNYIETDNGKTNNIGKGDQSTIYGRDAVEDVHNYVDLTNCKKIIFTGFSSDGGLRLFYNWDGTNEGKLTANITDFPKSTDTYVFDIEAFKKSKNINFFHLFGIKASSWNTKANISAIKVVEYTNAISGSGIDRTKNYRLNPYITFIDATGVTAATKLSIANPNCLIKANAGMVTNSQNVIVNDVCENLVLTDGHPFKAVEDFTATSASYTTTINEEAGAGTLCLPFAAAIPYGVGAWTLTYNGGNYAAAETVETTYIPANTPVLLNGSGEQTFSGAGVEIDADADNVEGALTGVFAATTVPLDSYVLQKHNEDVCFYKVATAKNINPFRAYLTAGSGDAPSLTITFPENDVTGISTTLMNKKVNSEIYNLKGQRISQPSKGLYIVNGKKYVVK